MWTMFPKSQFCVLFFVLAGSSARKTRSSAHCSSVFSQHVRGRRHPNVVPVGSSERLHGFVVELRLVPWHPLCSRQHARTTRRLCSCSYSKASGRRVRHFVWHRSHAGWFHVYFLHLNVTQSYECMAKWLIWDDCNQNCDVALLLEAAISEASVLVYLCCFIIINSSVISLIKQLFIN